MTLSKERPPASIDHHFQVHYKLNQKKRSEQWTFANNGYYFRPQDGS